MYKNIVEFVQKTNLCSGCGVCVAQCPKDYLVMKHNFAGDLVPMLCEDCSISCGKCLSVCPFLSGQYNPRLINREIYETQEHYNDYTGCFSKAYVGYRKELELRLASASGGLLTFILERLLEKRIVDKVAVVDSRVCNEEYKFNFVIVSDYQELKNYSGSIYHQVSIDQILKIIKRDSVNNWAVVGVPCMCTAIRKARVENIKYILGLACGMYQNKFYTEMLAKISGCNIKTGDTVYYRRKQDTNVTANNYGFMIKDSAFSISEPVRYIGLPYFLGKHGYFRLKCCDFCEDVFAESADACFMDAWLPEYLEDWRGNSIVLSRNQIINNLIENSDRVVCNAISVDKVVTSQKGPINRKFKKNVMSFSGFLSYLLLSYTRIKSKVVWARIGKVFGKEIFWLFMLDNVLIQKLFWQIKPALEGKLRRVINVIKR